MKIEKIINTYLDVSTAVDNLADFLTIFSDRTRMKIIFLLTMDDICVNDLCFILKINQSTVSHQLRTLKNSGLVNCYKSGKKTYYYLRNKNVEKLLYEALVASDEL